MMMSWVVVCILQGVLFLSQTGDADHTLEVAPLVGPVPPPVDQIPPEIFRMRGRVEEHVGANITYGRCKCFSFS